MNLLRPLLSVLSPAGGGAKLSILIFHRVLPVPDPIFPYEPDAAWFDRMLGRLSGWFNVLPLDEAVEMLGAARLPARAAAITFDDGYADNFSVAMPILKRHGLSATFFIATGFLDGGRMWNDTVIEAVRLSNVHELDLERLGMGHVPIASIDEKRRSIAKILDQIKYRPLQDRIRLVDEIAQVARVEPPQDLMMRSGQVLEMSRAGMQIGAHTISHPILAKLESASARAEIAGSKWRLEDILGRPVDLFAYPNGKPALDYQAKDVEIVRELGFKAAVSTRPAAAGAGCDLFQLPRFTPWDRSLFRFGARLARNLTTG